MTAHDLERKTVGGHRPPLQKSSGPDLAVKKFVDMKPTAHLGRTERTKPKLRLRLYA
jgi:hypothetical protein